MTENDAQRWLTTHYHVPRETLERLERFCDYLRVEMARHNLIAASTLETIWTRHIVDSAQLLSFALPGDWIDLGSGAGFPGLVIAAIRRSPVTLVETRRLRVEFMRRAARILGTEEMVTIIQSRAEAIAPSAFANISARAFAPLDRLLEIGHRFAGPATRWILPKGRGAQAELDTALRTWQGDFRIHPSVTDPASAIIVAERVRPRKQR